MDSLFTVALPTSFPHCKSALIPLLWEELYVSVHGFQTPNWIPNKPIFAKEISGSLFVLDQQKYESLATESVWMWHCLLLYEWEGNSWSSLGETLMLGRQGIKGTEISIPSAKYCS